MTGAGPGALPPGVPLDESGSSVLIRFERERSDSAGDGPRCDPCPSSGVAVRLRLLLLLFVSPRDVDTEARRPPLPLRLVGAGAADVDADVDPGGCESLELSSSIAALVGDGSAAAVVAESPTVVEGGASWLLCLAALLLLPASLFAMADSAGGGGGAMSDKAEIECRDVRPEERRSVAGGLDGPGLPAAVPAPELEPEMGLPLLPAPTAGMIVAWPPFLPMDAVEPEAAVVPIFSVSSSGMSARPCVGGTVVDAS